MQRSAMASTPSEQVPPLLIGITQLVQYLLSHGQAMHWNYCEQLLYYFKIAINAMDIHFELDSVYDVCGLIKGWYFTYSSACLDV